MNNTPCLAIIIPCYNEETVLPLALDHLSNILSELAAKNKISADSYLYCVDDGSKDDTWKIITHAHQINVQIKGVRLSKNVGHQNAVFAGLLNVMEKSDCAITIDADLQDDVLAIEKMIDCYHLDYDIVYGVRKSRKKDHFLKKLTAQVFYKTIHKMGADVIYNHADFRLLSSRAIRRLSEYKERSLFLRGLIPQIGLHSTSVFYDRMPRLAGKSKYTLKKMISLAWDGISSFSHAPLRGISILGLFSFLLAFGMISWAVIEKILSHTIPGWASIMIPMCFMGGIQLLSLGVVGEYIAKIYVEVKGRPRYFEDRELFDEKN